MINVNNVLFAVTEVVNFQRSDKVNLLLIGVGFILVIATFILIIVLKKGAK